MKNRLIGSILMLLLPLSIACAEVKFAPYYSLQADEGVAVPSEGDWMFALNLTNDLGLMAQLNAENKLVAFYELKYTGPGMRRNEGEQFTDRTLDHVLVLRHDWLTPWWGLTLKTQLDDMTEYKRTGTNELWGNGLYDFYRKGISLGLDKTFAEELLVETRLQYHALEFPNYSDLYTEWKLGGSNIDASTGKQNQGVSQVGVSAKYGGTKLSFDYTDMAYTKQKVVVASAQSDGSYYSSDLQHDRVYAFCLEHLLSVAGIVIVPSLSYKIKDSNQNYQLIGGSSTLPVQYIGGYYNYHELDLVVPVTIPISQRWSFSFTPEWDKKNYTSRPPMNPDYQFIGGTQENFLTIYTYAFSYQPNPVMRTVFFYTYQMQTSNMRFEKYLPYNYDGHYAGVSFCYSY